MLHIVITAMSIVIAVAGWIGIWLLSRQLRQFASAHDTRIAELEKQLHTVGASAVGVGQHVLRIERRLKSAPTTVSTAPATSPSEFPYSQAAALLNNDNLRVDGKAVSIAERQLLSLVKQRGAAFSAL